MTTLLKPTITYKLADLLAVAAEQLKMHSEKAAQLENNNAHALSHGFHSTMARGAQRNIDTLEAFRQAGVETVSAEYPIAEGAQRVFTNEDTSLSGQLHKGQIKPVSP